MPVNVPTSEEFDALAERVTALENAATPTPPPVEEPPVEPEPEPEPPAPEPDPPVEPTPAGLEVAYNATTREATLWWAAPREGNVVLTRNDSTSLFGTTTQPASLGTYKFGAHRSTATWVELSITAGGETITGRFPTGTSFARRVVDTAPPVSEPTTPTEPEPTDDGKLTWAPPAGWETWPVYYVKATTAQQVISGNKGPGRIVFPDTPTGPVILDSFRGFVVRGGSVKSVNASKVDGVDQRMIYPRNCTGVAFFEGLRLDGSQGETDGIVANNNAIDVYIQNCNVGPINGTQATNHADVFQTWQGVRSLRIDRLTGRSGYQGIKIQLVADATTVISVVDIRNTNLVGLLNQKFLIWFDPKNLTTKINFKNVWVEPVAGRSFGALSLWPGTTNSVVASRAKVVDGVATWPGMPNVTGEVREGTPPGGDFVPADRVGIGYVSPGYLAA